MPKIELIYDDDCPNVEPARESLREACSAAGIDPRWMEWDRSDATSPDHVRAYGSPTVLVDGRDVAGQEPGASKSCRIYTASDGKLTGVPPADLITASLLGNSAVPVQPSVSSPAPSAVISGETDAVRSQRSGAWATGGSVLAAVASSACCWLPLLLIGFGASAVGLAGFFERFRPLFLIAAALLLGLGFYYNYFRKETCAPGSACETPNSKLRRVNRGMLWVATAFVLAFALFPSYVGALIGAPSPPATAVVAGEPVRIELAVEGMTCGGCQANVEKALYGITGVIEADASYAAKSAVVEFLPDADIEPSALVDAIKSVGYEATVVAVSDSTSSEPLSLQFAVDGMTCGGCEAHVEKALVGVPGVLHADASYEEQSAIVELDPEAGTLPDSLITAIEKTGYKAVLNKPAAAEKQEDGQ